MWTNSLLRALGPRAPRHQHFTRERLHIYVCTQDDKGPELMSHEHLTKAYRYGCFAKVAYMDDLDHVSR